jgi:hypothetical protein
VRRRSACFFAAAMTTALVLNPRAPNAAQTPLALDDVLTRAAWYVTRFEEAFPSVVAEEHYRQKVTFLGPGLWWDARSGRVRDGDRRELKSDFLMVRSDRLRGWIPFRDVFEVDGRPVRERGGRLAKLLLDPNGSAFDQARSISQEGARYNIGPVERTINVPTQALQFLQPDNLRRSSFEKADEDRIDGVPVWEIRFEEVSVPTLIRTTGGMSLPATGAFWIEPSTGVVFCSVVRAELPEFRSEIIVRFEPHPELDVRVPAELKEKYVGRTYTLEGTATYKRFRRFRVTTEEVIK